MNIGKRRMEKILEEVETAVLKWQVFAESAKIREEIYNEIEKNLRRC